MNTDRKFWDFRTAVIDDAETSVFGFGLTDRRFEDEWHVRLEVAKAFDRLHGSRSTRTLRSMYMRADAVEKSRQLRYERRGFHDPR